MTQLEPIIRTKEFKNHIRTTIVIFQKKEKITKEIKPRVKICKECGKTFNYIYKLTPRNHCSVDCFKIHTRKKRVKMYGKGTGYIPKRPPKEYHCLNCGKIMISKNHRKYCDKICWRDKTDPLQRIEKECKQCGKEFIGNSRKVYCSSKCQLKHSAENQKLYISLKKGNTTQSY